jgi:hypothetical protein
MEEGTGAHMPDRGSIVRNNPNLLAEDMEVLDVEVG